MQKINKVGYLLEISYKGKCFDCFDEMKDKKTVKGVLKDYLLSKNITIFKGLQQAGRTDAKVSANSNYIYFMAKKFNVNILDEVVEKGLEIKSVKEVRPNLILPDLVDRRIYIYYYPKKFIKISKEEIEQRCKQISGNKDFSEFTNHKGLKLKNHIRDVKVEFKDDKLYFNGNSFMPQQVRIMSGYILTGEKKAMNPKFLILDEVILKGDIFEKANK